MKYAMTWVSSRWLKIAGYALVSLTIIGFVTLRLGALVPGQSSVERQAVDNVSSFGKIVDNPLYAPHKVIQLVVGDLTKPTIVRMRAVSALFGLLSVLAFYIFLRVWRTERVAVFGAALFASSSWFLHLARLASPAISTTLFVLLVVLWVYNMVYSKDHPRLVLFTGTALVLLSLYQPGLIWLLAAVGAWHSKNILLLAKRARIPYVSLAVAILLLGIIPLVFSFYRDDSLLRLWLLIPNNLPSVSDMLRAAGNVPLTLFWRSQADPSYGVGDLPLLDIFSFVMLILGLYQWRRQTKWQGLALGIVMLLGIVWLLAVNDRATFMMFALPFAYVTMTTGVTTLLQQWFTVFPRNPLARNVGIALLASLIGITAFYHLNRYFIAWPNAPETKAAFNLTSPAK